MDCSYNRFTKVSPKENHYDSSGDKQLCFCLEILTKFSWLINSEIIWFFLFLKPFVIVKTVLPVKRLHFQDLEKKAKGKTMNIRTSYKICLYAGGFRIYLKIIGVKIVDF